MLQYSLGKNKTSQAPGSGAGEIHESSAQKQEGRKLIIMMYISLELEVQEKQKPQQLHCI